MLRAIMAIFEQTRKLPIIRSIPGFNSLPPNVTPYNLRFYKLGNLVQTLGVFVHASWFVLFLLLGFYQMVWINAISCGIYVFNIIINRKGYHFTSAAIMVAEIIGHQIIAVRAFGLEAGFQYYIMVIGLFPFLMPKGKWVLKGIMLAACLISYILLDDITKQIPPIYTLNKTFLLYFHISNILFAFTSMVISGAYFNIAMHETENKLEEKTAELVLAEQKATLGRLATEMAHEIQNPLNFVNNFSEVNEEMLAELNDELKHCKDPKELAPMIGDILANSVRINTNGKRISHIVKQLQEEANKL